MNLFIDRVHRLPRVWSNRELARFAPMFGGDVVNVSGWKDIDKEGRRYRDYFSNAASYSITNYRAEARGFQDAEGEIFLDLEQPLPPGLEGRFDVVFNHTTLEHVYALHTAFGNLCRMSRDAVILVVPFIQQFHADYGDYWRLSPMAVKRLFEDNGYTLLYLSFNSHRNASVYVFAIASRQPERWAGRFDYRFSCRDPIGGGPEPMIGCRAIPNDRHRFYRRLRGLFSRKRGQD